MVDKSKVVIMTRTARQTKKNQKKISPAVGYFMFDYVFLQVLKGAFAVTLLFVAAAIGYLVYTMEKWIARSTIYDLIKMTLSMGKLYAIVMAITILFLAVIYSLRYIQSKELLEDEEYLYRRLKRYYDVKKR